MSAQLLSIALSAHELVVQAVEKKHVVAPSTHRDVLEKFFPLLADIVVEVRRFAAFFPAATHSRHAVTTEGEPRRVRGTRCAGPS